MNSTILPYFENWKRSANKNVKFILAEAEVQLSRDDLEELLQCMIDQCNYELIYLQYVKKFHQTPVNKRGTIENISQMHNPYKISNINNK